MVMEPSGDVLARPERQLDQLLRPGRPHPPGDPGSPVEERRHGAGTGRAVPAGQPAISKHLKVLERAGLITRGRDAQHRPCRLEADALRGTEWLDGTGSSGPRSQRLDILRSAPCRPGSRRPGRAAMRTTGDLIIEPRRARDLVITRIRRTATGGVRRMDPTRAAATVVRARGWQLTTCEMDLRAGAGSCSSCKPESDGHGAAERIPGR